MSLSYSDLRDRYIRYLEQQELELDKGNITEDDIMSWEEFLGEYESLIN